MANVFSVEVGGEVMTFETGTLAKQANGSVTVSMGETVLLVTACFSEEAREGIDFFPLLVDYEERFYSAGKIPGGFIKREGRPSETAILAARLTDRSIRSLFPEHMRNDVHVVATTLSVDQENSPSVLAINGASAALTISDIPWEGPVGAVRIGYIDGQLVVNPTESLMRNSSLDLVVSGHRDGITMVEAGANEVSEDLLVEALALAQEEIKKIVDLQLEMRKKIGKEKVQIPEPLEFPDIDRWIKDNLYEEIKTAVMIHEKKPRAKALDEIERKAIEALMEEHPDKEGYIKEYIGKLIKKAVRELIVFEGKRADGRRTDEIRPISCKVGGLPRTHGSAIFTRGETQALVTTTLGMVGEDDQLVDGLQHDETSKRFMLHYNFPPYSVGEVRPMRGPGRREIGHGALAERAVRPLLPDEALFPYAIRVVSDILESNGSSSMASVCGASLSLMDAGVPIKKAVAGVAMGLIKEGDKVVVLTDIQGLEDHFGDMDFKVAGTKDGVTALQMDNKAGGITKEILTQALEQAKQGRLFILGKMEEAIKEPREELSSLAPRIYTLKVNQEKIRDIIGPGGKTIRSIVAETGVKIDVEDNGTVLIASSNRESAQKAISIIEELVKEVEAGDVYLGKVTRLMPFGAFVEVLPGKEGLLHVSEVSTHHVAKVDDILKPGDMVLVVVKEIDDMGRINLSRKRIFDRKEEVQALYEEAFSEEMIREEKIESSSKKRERPPVRDRKNSPRSNEQPRRRG